MSRSFLSYALIAAVVIALAAIRLSGPEDLMIYDQERQTSYVLDILKNGKWIIQTDWMGFPASKPPLYNWIAAVASLPFGKLNRFALCFPAILSTFAIALLVCGTGMKRFGWTAGLLAAMAYVATLLTGKQIILVRTDGLFALTVVLTAFAAWKAWQKGGDWIWFWLAATAGMLTKGPVGLMLGACGLIAAFWEWRTGHPAPIKGRHTVGIVLLLAVTAGWFALSVWSLGWPAIYQRLFVQELAGNAVQAHDMKVFPGQWFYKPPLYFLARCVPWSFVALVASWRVWFRPAADDTERRFERFLFCWFWVGIIPFCLGASQRADHLMPLVPAAALLAGREMARWMTNWKPVRVAALVAGVSVVFLVVMYVDHTVMERKKMEMVRSEGMKTLAAQLGNVEIIHTDDPFALQFYMNTCQRSNSFARAALALRGEMTVLVAVRKYDDLLEALGTNAPPLVTVAQWTEKGEPFVRIVSNRERK